MVAHRMTDQIIIISVSVSWDDDVDYADNVMGYSSLDPATTTRVSVLLFVRWRRTINSCMSNDEWKHFPRQPEPERTVATTCCAAGIAKAASATTWRGWLRIAISIPNVHGRGHIKGYYHRRWGRCSRGWYGSDIIVVAASNEDEWFRIGCHPVLQRIGYVSPVEDFYFFTYELHFAGGEPHHFLFNRFPLLPTGGPFGVEPSLKAAGNLYAIIGFAVMPILWSLPESIMTYELSTLFPCASGGVRFVSWYLGEFIFPWCDH